MEGCRGSLTDEEVEDAPMGAKIMTFECGMRLLTDYLQERYLFLKIHYPEQNLDRTRTQLKLVKDMEEKWDIMAHRKKLNDIYTFCRIKKTEKNHEMFFYKNISWFFLLKNWTGSTKSDIVKIRLKLCKDDFIFYSNKEEFEMARKNENHGW